MIRLFPYVRGYYPRDTLARLWGYVEAQGAARKLFYAQPGTDEERGDLTHFVEYFADSARRLLLIPERDQQPMGLVWLDDIIPGFKAAMNVFYRRRFWGTPAREATTLAVAYCFNDLHFQTLWGYTPWPEAQSHAEAVGFQAVARLPGFARCDDRPLDITILRLEKGEWATSR